MPALEGLEWTFDTVASTYEKVRLGYVKELYRTLFDYIPIITIYDTIDLQLARKIIPMWKSERLSFPMAMNNNEEVSPLCSEIS